MCSTPMRCGCGLPWDPTNVTVADMVHGGAIAALADVAVMAAAWAGAAVPDSLRGVTTSMSMQFLAPARATDLIGRRPGVTTGQDAGERRRRRRHAGRRGGRQGDRVLQGGMSQPFGVMTARPWILPSCKRS